MKVCKFCGLKKEAFIDAHIIPRAFFEYTKEKAGVPKSESMRMLTNTKKGFPLKQLRIGWYDTDLLCADCEKLFNPHDDYGINLLVKEESRHVHIESNNHTVGWVVNRYDYDRLKLFFVSVLWRAGASELPEFKSINLGPWLDKARSYLSTGKEEYEDQFTYIVARFLGKEGLSFGLNPHPEIKGGFLGSLNVYRFYLGAGYVLYIKADSRPFPASIHFASQKGKPLIIVSRGELRKSQEFGLFKNMIKDIDAALAKIKSKS